jgi:hypothetical protein
MKKLGFFQEFDEDNAENDIMASCVRSEPATMQTDVVRYLQRGIPVIDVMEVSPDVLDGSAVDETGSILTDGEWYWREDLAHYVSKYNIALPDEFLADIAGRAYELPLTSVEQLAVATQAVIEDWQRRS